MKNSHFVAVREFINLIMLCSQAAVHHTLNDEHIKISSTNE